MKMILIDAKNALFRFGWTGRTLHTSEGKPTGAIFGILRCMLKLKRKYPDARFVAVWDGEEREKGWRTKLFPGYKNRATVHSQPTTVPTTSPASPMPTVGEPYKSVSNLNPMQEIAKAINDNKPVPLGMHQQYVGEAPKEIRQILAQISQVKEVLRLARIPQAEVKQIEADDLIGMLTFSFKADGVEPIIYSSDKDFMQFVCRGITVIRDVDKAKPLRPESELTIQKKFGCCAIDLLKLRAFAGDPSDCIPVAMKGIGIKKAQKILAKGWDPSSANWALKKEQLNGWAQVLLNYRLMKIPTHPTCEELTKVQAGSCKREISRIQAEVAKPKRGTYKEMVALLKSLELDQAVAARKKIWQLQRIPLD